MILEPKQSWTSESLTQEHVLELSHGLHRAAQPLTVLQGYLELAMVGAHSAQEYQQLIKRAWDESQRLSTCFEQIRDLLWRPSPSSPLHDVASAELPRATSMQESQKAGCAHV